MTRSIKNMAASVKRRLRDRTDELGGDYEWVALRFVLERLLYRLSVSDYGDQFVVKGAMLFPAWTNKLVRPTRDLDLWGANSLSSQALTDMFREVLALPVERDGIEFDIDAIAASTILADAYAVGTRITTVARLENERHKVQVDIAFGAAVTPAPKQIEYPTILPFPAPHLRVYPQQTAIAEKFHAMVQHGVNTSRLKDFYDVATLARLFDFEGEVLSQAISNTFMKNATRVPTDRPPVLMPEFARVPESLRIWPKLVINQNAFLHGADLASILEEVANFILPPAHAAARHESFDRHWSAGESWS